MSCKEENDPIISDKDYAIIISKNESYKGFVEYPNGLVSFVFTEVVVQTTPLNKTINRFTNYVMQTGNKYHEQIIAVNDAIQTNNRNVNQIKQAYSQSMEDGKIKANFQLKAAQLQQKIKQEYHFKIIKNPTLKNSIDNELLQYERIIKCMDKDKPINLNQIPEELKRTDQAKAYIKYFKIVAIEPTSYISQGPSDEEMRRRQYQKALENWKNADPIATKAVEGMAYGMVAVPVIFAPEIGITATTIGKGALSWGFQAATNGVRDVNYLAVGIDASPVPWYIGPAISSAVEIKPFSSDDKLRIAGYNKPLKDFAAETYLGSMGAGLGHVSGFKPLVSSTISSGLTYGSTWGYYYRYDYYYGRKDE